MAVDRAADAAEEERQRRIQLDEAEQEAI